MPEGSPVSADQLQRHQGIDPAVGGTLAYFAIGPHEEAASDVVRGHDAVPPNPSEDLPISGSELGCAPGCARHQVLATIISALGGKRSLAGRQVVSQGY